MAVKIRLKQTGSRNRRLFRLVAVDESKKRDGAVIENLGYINPQVKPTKIEINEPRVQYWLKVGAQMTESVQKLLEKK
jgi:small subunit ribosomal protein S16